MDWKVAFFRYARDGSEPAKDFILSQPDDAIGEILHVFRLLDRFNLSLGKPYVEKVKGKLWSLRIKHSTDYYRIFYFTASGRKFILLHAVLKKRDKLLKSDIELAKKRMDDYNERSLSEC